MGSSLDRGPLVRRSARVGGTFFVVGATQFIGVMVLVQLAYPGYTAFGNLISDLGAHRSPDAATYNISVGLLGALGLLGSWGIRSAFSPRRSARAGLSLLAVAGIAASLTGAFPEGTHVLGGAAHGVAAGGAFLSASIGLLLLSAAMRRDTRWEGYRRFTFLSGFVAFVALLLFVGHVYVGLGPGGMERTIVGPILLWGIVAGVHLARLPTFAPSTISRS